MHMIFFSATTRVTVIDKEEWEKRKKSIKAKLFLKRENLLTKVIIWLSNKGIYFIAFVHRKYKDSNLVSDSRFISLSA